MAWEATAVGARIRARDDEGRLVRAAAAGESPAIAALVRHHEDRIFNVAFRITGSEHQAANATRQAFLEVLGRLPVGVGAQRAVDVQLLTAACDAAYDAIESAGAELPEAVSGNGGGGELAGAAEPDERALLEDWEAHIRAAHARLSPRQRELLALREPAAASYGEIAQIAEIAEAAVPHELAAARISLHDELRGTALGAEPMPSEDCEAALPLMAMRDDEELPDGSDDAGWLIEHLVGCHGCLVYLDAMQDARLSLAAWEPVAAPSALCSETVAAAAGLAGRYDDTAGHEPGAATTASGAPAAVERAPAAGREDATQVLTTAPAEDEVGRRRRRGLLLAAGWGAAGLLALLAVVAGGAFDGGGGGGDRPEATLQPPAETRIPGAPAKAPARARSGKRPRKRDAEPEAPTPAPPVARQPVRRAPVVVVAPPARRRSPPPSPRRAPRPRPEPPRTRPVPAPTPQEQAPPPAPAPAPGGGAPTTPTTPPPQEPIPPSS